MPAKIAFKRSLLVLPAILVSLVLTSEPILQECCLQAQSLPPANALELFSGKKAMTDACNTLKSKL